MQGRRWVDPKLKTEYLEWLLTVPGERDPSTKTDMAKHLGVSMRTLYNWEGEEDFQTKMRSVKLEWGSRWYPEILQELMKVVTDGPPAQKVQAAKVLLQHIDVQEEDKHMDLDLDEAIRAKFTDIARELGYEVLESE